MTADTQHLNEHIRAEKVTGPPELSGVLMVLFLMIALGAIALLAL
jgi:hypothetical protein